MIYYFLYELLYTHFKDKDWVLVKALNVFQYVTFRTAYATITALLISLFFGGRLIEALKQWNVGQQIREEGPQGHQVKRGTPTMGGVLIVGSVLISTLLWAKLSSVFVWTAMGATLLFGLIGFVDDYSKIAKQRSLGLTGRQKLLAQLLVAVMVWAVLFLSTRFWGGNDYSWNFSIPFIKATAKPYGPSFIGPYLYLVLIGVVLLGSSNAVNLTDGLDGLAISITVIAMGALTGFTYVSSDARWANYLDITHRPEAAELTVFCGAMVGASLGFLWYNA
ncbi:MAG TPA: phospho-N-acetylmuramoyl-pentapeptide-transferase, partial [Pyrinomonadaceae bacterium]